MKRVIIQRLMTLPFLLLGISLLTFVLMTFTPGSYLDNLKMQRDIKPELIEAQKKQFGLDKPWWQQYFIWLKNVLQLNWGESYKYRIPVTQLIAQRLPATFLLSLTSTIFALLIAVPLGVLAAMYKDSIFDRITGLLAFLALSVPEFFLALLGLYVVAQTGWLPTGGLTSIEHEFLPWTGKILDIGHHLIMPTIVLGLSGAAGMMRIMRANFLDAIRAEFVITARAKGLPEMKVMFKHVLPNAINPLISSLGFIFAGLLSGSVLVENILNYPGLGRLTFEAFMSKDQFVVLASVMMGSCMLILGNLISDVLLAWSDPRIRAAYR
ncbi:MAG: ABC transporter permease [Methylacidiphilales bacterium]|nr:ABC transporter permease [Candidatus Methylacidiphilales bacterium]MDW8348928.1 ABC transporter permease [Verrucomicrobiae bacterium]